MKLLLEMFISFFKIGAFTIGGGYAMLPLIQKEVVENKKWIGEEEFLDMVAISQSAPGPIAVNLSVFVGNKIKGVRGLLATVLGATLPSFLIIILVASVFIGIEKHPIVARVFMGIRPAVVALIAAPVIKMAKTAKMDRKNFYIPLSAVILVGILGVTPIYVIIGFILFGIISTYIRRRMK
ncbi:chromate transporter [Youngiibacter fragilis]|uniref:Chromate transporter n=1 Tax=Youngiibacter fragilis 232.1 TaxID=994573 RepID=V7I342_9CLOT|nr:chromate transporter [Youngiibacter fragilis]ETA79701.1 chromate transporter [Youngiibacter fragilis 232.1]